MTAYAERCEREDEEDRLRALRASDKTQVSKYIGGTSLIALDTSRRIEVGGKNDAT